MFVPHRNYIKLLVLAGYSRGTIDKYCMLRQYNDIESEYDCIEEECYMIPHARAMIEKNRKNLRTSEVFIDDRVMDTFHYKYIAKDLIRYAMNIRGFTRCSTRSRPVLRLLESINERQLIECFIMVGVAPQRIIKAVRAFMGTRKDKFSTLGVISAYSYFFWYFPISERSVYYTAFDISEYLVLSDNHANSYYDYHRQVVYGNENEVKTLFGLATSDERRQQIFMLYGKIMTLMQKRVGTTIPNWHVDIFTKLLEHIKEQEDSEAGPEAQRRHMEQIFTRILKHSADRATLDELKDMVLKTLKKEALPEQDEPYKFLINNRS